MANKTTLPLPWRPLAEAAGGVSALQRMLGWPTMTFYRATRSEEAPTKARLEQVNTLARRLGVTSPYDSAPPKPPPPPLDVLAVEMLELCGDTMARGVMPSEATTERLRSRFSDDQLIALAESDKVSENVHRVVAYLLGL